ncbi:transcription elongation regulator 1-like protein isoform X3 [Perca fluviatilis]|uniref:transcription elongation regulator 1-like protein isoform X3 n=1 Tax=Perca fluviatilis TaxID=8168 RepID=UPI001962B2DB|nr:transcription elongation regulator 1-like protein isoform X3 [Perca fluviatilis]
MMLPVSRFKGQPVGMITTTAPWLSFSCDPAPHWLWLATPPLLFYQPAVFIPEHTHLIQWERPAVEVVPFVPSFYRSSHLHPPHLLHPLPMLAEGWISPEEVFQRRDKPLLLTNHISQRPERHTPRTRSLLRSPDTGGAYWKWAEFHIHRDNEAWPIVLTNHWHRGAWSRPVVCLERSLSPPTQLCREKWPVLPVQVMKEVHPSFFSSRFSSRFTLLTNYRHKKQRMSGRKVSYRGAFLLRTERTIEDNKQCISVDRGGEDEGSEGGRKDRRPVASTPVPGSPWCVVWTGDDRVFFFNPTMHLSVWERPGELIGQDISRIIMDPPHKRKKKTSNYIRPSCQLPGLHGNDEDEDDEHISKRNRTEEPLSLVPRPGEVKLLPLELRIDHFREMMLERGVSAFSTWEKELHKMVFDPRYLLLTSDQRKQVFDQFVKSRVKDEYKEKKSKLQKAREEFKQLLEEAKITSRSTFKEFSARYRGDQRFESLNRKKEQEVVFHHYITSLKKRDKENRARLRKMR